MQPQQGRFKQGSAVPNAFVPGNTPPPQMQGRHPQMRQGQPANPSMPQRSTRNHRSETFVKPVSTTITRQTDSLSERVGGSHSLRNIIIASGCFFLLFSIISGIKFLNDSKQFKAQDSLFFETSLSQQASNVSRRIDARIAEIDNALFSQSSAENVVTFITNLDFVDSAALIDANGAIIAQSGANSELASQIDLRNFGQQDVQITSLITREGLAQPLIIRRQGSIYLSALLNPQSLVGTQFPNASLIWDGGRMIDGGINLGSPEALNFYDISSRRLVDMTKSSDATSVIEHSFQGEGAWLGAAPIPKSTALSFLNIQNRSVPPMMTQNLLLFGLLLLGMVWLIWTLINQLARQMDKLREKHNSDEISKQRYQAAVDGSRGGVWEIDLAKNTAYLSPSLAKVFNLPEDHVNLPMSQFLGLFASEDRDRLFGAIRRSHVSGEFDIELGLAQLPIYMACRGRPSVRGADQAKIIIGMAMDITEVRGAQNRLQAAEARLFDALSSMTDSFVIWDQMDRLVLWNQRFESFFGFQPGQLQQGLDHATIDYHAKQVIESVTERAEGDEIELKDGRWIRYSETRTADGGRVSIGTEVTAIRSREHELQVNQDALEKTINVLRESQVRIVELAESYEQEKIRAEEASQSKSEFLANMSHELRTPLNAINGFSDIMKKELFGPLGDPRYKEYVSDILFSGQHLLSLINDILDMSKIEAGKMTLNTESLKINDMIAQVIRIVRGRADDNRLKLIFEEVETQPIEADPRAIKQVLLNLMTNAIKFTPEGGTVKVVVEPKSAGLILRVSDTGIGISEEDIQRLAQPFEQIDSQHSKQHEGTGLGLALSKSLVELHGGNFKMESELGKGTTVIFTLPVTPPKKVEKEVKTEVGSEFTKLAKDIADVLSVGESRMTPNQPVLPIPNMPMPAAAPQPVAPQSAAIAPPPPAPMPYPQQVAQPQQISPQPYQPAPPPHQKGQSAA